ncbi:MULTISPECIES: hypothetical protein [unclassified Nonomuraea]|uniref:hypothetical protein n=1 Tax=unclassified Nonomuraea TaxID=2593643 RepID=UPI0033D07258
MKTIVRALTGLFGLALLAAAAPAWAAGNWAVTYLDPAPARFAAATPYTLGFWVLQHGNHPYQGDLGRTGLRLTGQDGEVLMFAGSRLPEAGHYATALVVPRGTWRVEGVQGRFQPHPLGTLTVPGGLAVNPVPHDAIPAAVAPGADYWGQIRPPGFPAGKGTTVLSSPAPAAPAPVAAPAATPEDVPGSGGRGVPPYTLAIAAAAGALLTVALLRGPTRRRSRPDAPDDTVVLPG